MQICDQDIFTIRQIHKAWTLFLLVTTTSPFPAKPTGSPCLKTVTVNRTRSAHGKAIHPVCIDQCRIVEAGLSLDPGLAQIIIRNIIAAL